MSLDKLLIIFLIIILPIAFILNIYVNAQAETLNMQSLYDGKLYSATSDAIKAYQENSFNESTSDLSTLQMRNIEASANVFLNSIANNFSMQGFSKETIQEYIPAVVFTMYNGYYIYSKYENTLQDSDVITEEEATDEIPASTYQNGELLYGVKPFVHYSCRYKIDEDNSDFVIIYSLDNYITIEGKIKGNWVYDSGYVIDINPENISFVDDHDDDENYINYILYRGAKIEREPILQEYVGTKLFPYTKVNGIKYYFDKDYKDSGGVEDPKWFSLINDTKTPTPYKYNTDYDYSAYNYYKDAYDFTNRLINTYGLGDLTPEKAIVDLDSSADEDDDENFYYKNFKTTGPNAKIFELKSDDGISIEEPGSNFNEHRLAVIRYTIEKNLSIAIANYNTYENDVSANFQMPVLNETEWDKILNNISIISFMQGIPMGTKTYNGCAVVSNNKNGEVVAEDSIYIVKDITGFNKQGEDYNSAESPQYYYNVRKKGLNSELNNSSAGVLNVDLEGRSYYDENGDDVLADYYFPKLYYADYGSIVNQDDNVNISANTTDYDKLYDLNGNIYKYLDKYGGSKLAKAYYTALGRERYSTYKVNKSKIRPDDSVFYQNNGHWYCIFKNYLSWVNAEAYCESIGGHLVTINSDREQKFIEEYIGKVSGNKKFWIGATDEVNEGKLNWKWITGEPFNYNNFGTDQPDDRGGQDYAVIQNYSDGYITDFKWDDIDPYAKSDDEKKNIYFICEWE